MVPLEKGISESMEYLDVLTENGIYTGKKASKSECHQKGIWHRSAYAFIINSKNEVMLQIRSHLKKVEPNTIDITLGGHILAGEFGIDALRREAKEELGIEIKEDDIKYLTCSTSENIDKEKNIINRQFNEYFVIFKDIQIENILIQPEEVERVLYFKKDEILDKIRNHKEEMCVKDMAWKILEMYYAKERSI